MPALDFDIQDQEQEKWCWAATAISTHIFYGGNEWIKQCDLVNHELKQTTCCQNGKDCDCNQVWYLSKALTTTGNLSHILNEPINWDDIKNIINNGNILCAQISCKNGYMDHCVIISGYFDDNNTQLVVVNDPESGIDNALVKYTTVIRKYRRLGIWSYSYLTKG